MGCAARTRGKSRAPVSFPSYLELAHGAVAELDGPPPVARTARRAERGVDRHQVGHPSGVDHAVVERERGGWTRRAPAGGPGPRDVGRARGWREQARGEARVGRRAGVVGGGRHPGKDGERGGDAAAESGGEGEHVAEEAAGVAAGGEARGAEHGVQGLARPPSCHRVARQRC